MRGFGVTGSDFALECQMDKLARLVGMNPVEFRILNAYRDGDMKAHRRVAKNCALVECCQVAAEKANWPIREEFKRMSSLEGGGGERAAVPQTATDRPVPAAPSMPPPPVYEPPAAPIPVQQPPAAQPVQPQPAPAQPAPAQPAPPPTPEQRPAARPGANRFSSVIGTRRR